MSYASNILGYGAGNIQAQLQLEEIKRQRAFATDQRKQADALITKKGPGDSGSTSTQPTSGNQRYTTIPKQGGLNATEQRIYDAAKKSNLDPDKAVQLYRKGQY